VPVTLSPTVRRAGVLLVCLACTSVSVRAQAGAAPGAAAVAKAVLWGVAMAPGASTADLPRDVQHSLVEYRQREQTFRSALKAPPGATSVEQALFNQRVAIERVLFCLYPRRDIARVAAAYASDADVSPDWDGSSDMPRREAAFIDDLLRDLEQKWLAPYLHLMAGHRKLCASQMAGLAPDAATRALAEEALRQIAHAGNGGQPIIHVVAEHLLATNRCLAP
jgi:hypothetical protein